MPVRSPQISSCSMAAARNVSAAHSSTLRPSFLKRCASLPMVVVLPGPFTPTTMITAGGSATCGSGPLGGLQNFQQMLADQALQFGGIAHQVALHALADALQNLRGGLHADVGADQRVLQLVQQIGVDLLAAAERVFQRVHQAGARLLHAALQSFEKSGLLLDGAE